MNDRVEAYTGIQISQERAIRMYAAHGLIHPLRELIADMGDHPAYDKGAVYAALGY